MLNRYLGLLTLTTLSMQSCLPIDQSGTSGTDTQNTNTQTQNTDSNTQTDTDVQNPIYSINADLSATTLLSGNAPFSTTLNGSNSTSDLAIISYEWDFDGDGIYDQSTANSTINHVYEEVGSYSAQLRIKDSSGQQDITSININATQGNRSPIAAFTSMGSNLQITFDASTSSDPDNNSISFEWVIENTPYSTESITHTFSQAGTYPVLLIVTDSLNAKTELTKQIIVSTGNTAPTADFETQVNGLDVSFDADISTDLEGPIDSYQWSINQQNFTTKTVDYTFPSFGSFEVTLIVKDQFGLTDDITKTIELEDNTPANVAPNAVITSSNQGSAYVFNASESNDSDGEITSYLWLIDSQEYTEITAAHEFTQSGQYDVILTVTDNKGAIGQDSSTVTINITNQNPVAAFEFENDELVVSFDASASEDTDGEIVSYQWIIEEVSYDSSATFEHTFSDYGTYEVMLTVIDDMNQSHSIAQTIEILEANNLPRVFFSQSSYGEAYYTLSGVNSYDQDFDPLAFSWEFSDGTVFNGPRITYKASSTASVDVTLQAFDGKGYAEDTITLMPGAASIDRPYEMELFNAATTYLNCEGCHSTNNGRPFVSEGDMQAYDNDIRTMMNKHGADTLYAYPVDLASHRGSGTIVTESQIKDWSNLINLVDADLNGANQPPLPNFDFTIDNKTVTFTSTSTDAENDALSYEWDFGDFGVAQGASVVHEFESNISYIVKLTVSDGNTYKEIHKKIEL